MSGHAEIDGNEPTKRSTIGQDDDQRPISVEPTVPSTPARGLFHTLAEVAADDVICTWPRLTPEQSMIHRLADMGFDQHPV